MSSNTDIHCLYPFYFGEVKTNDFAHVLLHFAKIAPKHIETIAAIASHYQYDRYNEEGHGRIPVPLRILGEVKSENTQSLNLAEVLCLISATVLNPRMKLEAIQVIEESLQNKGKSIVEALQRALEIDPFVPVGVHLGEQQAQLEDRIRASIVATLGGLITTDLATIAKPLWELHVRIQTHQV